MTLTLWTIKLQLNTRCFAIFLLLQCQIRHIFSTKKYWFFLSSPQTLCYGLSLLPLIICLGRFCIACRYIFNLWQLCQGVDSLALWLENWFLFRQTRFKSHHKREIFSAMLHSFVMTFMSLEPIYLGSSDEYLQSRFLRKNKKNIYMATPRAFVLFWWKQKVSSLVLCNIILVSQRINLFKFDSL